MESSISGGKSVAPTIPQLHVANLENLFKALTENDRIRLKAILGAALDIQNEAIVAVCWGEDQDSVDMLKNAKPFDEFIKASVAKETFVETLRELRIRGSKLKGMIPEEIVKFKNIEILDLSDNYLDGPIPAGISDLTNLRELNLSGNRFSGSIPPKIWQKHLKHHNDPKTKFDIWCKKTDESILTIQRDTELCFPMNLGDERDVLLSVDSVFSCKISQYKSYCECKREDKPFLVGEDVLKENFLLLILFPSLLSNFENPAKAFNNLKYELFDKMKKAFEEGSRYSLYYLLNTWIAVTAAAQRRPFYEDDLHISASVIEKLFLELMQSDYLDDPRNFLRLLVPFKSCEQPMNMNKREWRALALQDGGFLATALQNEATFVFQASQVINLVDRSFKNALHKAQNISCLGVFGDYNNIGSTDSSNGGCGGDAFERPGNTFSVSSLQYKKIRCNLWNPRSCPATVFFLEFLNSFITLCVVYAESSSCRNDGHSPFTSLLAFLVVTGFIYEVGQYQTTKTIYLNFWNIIDIVTYLLLLLWIFQLFSESFRLFSHICICISHIFICISLLRYLTIDKSFGPLVLSIIKILDDMGKFFVVFMFIITGFALTLYTLYSYHGDADNESSNSSRVGTPFQTIPSTFKSLFLSFLGGLSLDDDSLGEDVYVTTVVDVTSIFFVVVVAIMLVNLLIARMSATYESIEASAKEQWSRQQALLVQQHLLLNEKHVLYMLPPPFNLFPVLLGFMKVRSVLEWCGLIEQHQSQHQQSSSDDQTRNNKTNNRIYSITGTLSDVIMRVLFSVPRAVCYTMLIFDAEEKNANLCLGPLISCFSLKAEVDSSTKPRNDSNASFPYGTVAGTGTGTGTGPHSDDRLSAVDVFKEDRGLKIERRRENALSSVGSFFSLLRRAIVFVASPFIIAALIFSFTLMEIIASILSFHSAPTYYFKAVDHNSGSEVNHNIYYLDYGENPQSNSRDNPDSNISSVMQDNQQKEKFIELTENPNPIHPSNGTESTSICAQSSVLSDKTLSESSTNQYFTPKRTDSLFKAVLYQFKLESGTAEPPEMQLQSILNEMSKFGEILKEVNDRIVRIETIANKRDSSEGSRANTEFSCLKRGEGGHHEEQDNTVMVIRAGGAREYPEEG